VIVLDTHVWVWYVDDPAQLSTPARTAIDQALGEKAILISSISAWEVALLVVSRRLELTIDVQDWIAKCEALPFFTFVPVDNAIFLKSTFLSGQQHNDPADRIIIATALMRGVPIVTKDRRIRKYAKVQSIW
jgi:PIN domain nuclease of toxin-antitoxin system